MIGYVSNVCMYVCMYVGVGIFKVLDDQCRIPNPSDKRFASQMYKEYGKQMYVCMCVCMYTLFYGDTNRYVCMYVCRGCRSNREYPGQCNSLRGGAHCATSP